MSDLRSRIDARLGAAGVELVGTAVDQMSIYFGLLAKWNRQLNLTSLEVDSASDDAIDRLLIEPAVVATATGVVRSSDSVLVDLGSGGGSPAIPLRIAAPTLHLVMVESRTRKAAFLRDACRQLGLDNVEVLATRLESLIDVDGLPQADLISIRAIKVDESVVALAGQLLGSGGRILWFSSDSNAFQWPVQDGSHWRTWSPKPLVGTSQLVTIERQ